MPRQRTICTFPECTKPHHARGFCDLHLYRLTPYGDPAIVKLNGKAPTDPLARLLGKVTFTDSCWLYEGMKSHDGYGIMRVGSMRDGTRRQAYVHVFLYEALFGPLPQGLQLDHVRARGCVNRNCVCLDHLQPVTSYENTMRGNNFTAVLSRVTHCPKGHEYTEENTYRWARHPQRRACLTCRKNRVRHPLPTL